MFEWKEFVAENARPVYLASWETREAALVYNEDSWTSFYYDHTKKLLWIGRSKTKGQAFNLGNRFLEGRPKERGVVPMVVSHPQEIQAWVAAAATLGVGWERDEWDVPILDNGMQATSVPEPVTKWGTIARTSLMPGTYHFYAEDRHFNAIWNDRDQIPRSGCAVAAELNFSSSPYYSRSKVLWDIYRKRWLARYWQEKGVHILVDLNVHEKFEDLVLLGVPAGWGSYITRSNRSDLDLLKLQYNWGVDRADGADLFFVVYGGGKLVSYYCESQGWHWVPEHSLTARKGM